MTIVSLLWGQVPIPNWIIMGFWLLQFHFISCSNMDLENHCPSELQKTSWNTLAQPFSVGMWITKPFQTDVFLMAGCWIFSKSFMFHLALYCFSVEERLSCFFVFCCLFLFLFSDQEYQLNLKKNVSFYVPSSLHIENCDWVNINCLIQSMK